VIVVDKDYQYPRSASSGVGISSKVDPVRDVFILPNTCFDTLDFARRKIGLGGRMGIDATTKIPPETDHAWGDALESAPDVAAMVERRWVEAVWHLQLGKLTFFGYDMR